MNDPNLDDLIQTILAAVATAREKHPRFARGPEDAYKAILSEHLEWQSQAMLICKEHGRVDMQRLEKRKRKVWTASQHISVSCCAIIRHSTRHEPAEREKYARVYQKSAEPENTAPGMVRLSTIRYFATVPSERL